MGKIGKKLGRLVPKVLGAADLKLYGVLSEKAKEMRLHPTDAERCLWGLLQNKKMGFKFRRQHVIYRYIVDFYCVEKSLIIEVDGSVHDSQKIRDQARENILQSLGCKILRFSNEQVLNNAEAVIAKIQAALV
jgi:very-short-patch-repair endonuclease